jgi:hypothetical protein
MGNAAESAGAAGPFREYGTRSQHYIRRGLGRRTFHYCMQRLFLDDDQRCSRSGFESNQAEQRLFQRHNSRELAWRFESIIKEPGALRPVGHDLDLELLLNQLGGNFKPEDEAPDEDCTLQTAVIKRQGACSRSSILPITFVCCVLASTAGGLQRGHSHRLGRVTAAVSYSYFLVVQTGLG